MNIADLRRPATSRDHSGRTARVAESVGASSSVVEFESDTCYFYVSLPSDIRWITGFNGSFGALLISVGSGTGTLFTDSRYVGAARSLGSGLGSEIEVRNCGGSRGLIDAVVELVGRGNLFFVAEDVSHAFYLALSGSCGGTLRSIPSPLKTLRRIKEEWEIERMSMAASITDRAMETLLSESLSGLSERMIRDRLDATIKEFGADDVAFETIVAAGVNAAVPHHHPGDTIVGQDDLVIVDVGATVDGYRSDMTRTIVVGSPDDERLDLLRQTITAQAAGVAAVRAGARRAVIDEACRREFSRWGVETLFIHGVGHGVGLDIHEEPFLSSPVDDILEASEVVTVEPGLYRDGVGGARIEDLVVVVEDGCRVLTQTPKELTCQQSRRTT